MLVQREVRTAEAGEDPGYGDGGVSHACDTDANGLGSLGVFPDGTHPQPEWRAINHPCDRRHRDEPKRNQRIVQEAGYESVGTDDRGEPWNAW